MVDFKASTVAPLDNRFIGTLTSLGAHNVLVNDDVWIVFYGYPTVYKNKVEVGELPADIKYVKCKNGLSVTSKYAADDGQTFYYVTGNDDLVAHQWADVKTGKYKDCKTIAKKVVDFALQGNKPVVLMADKLVMVDGQPVDLQAVDAAVKWTTLASIGGRVLLAGEQGSQGVLQVVGSKGAPRGQLQFALTNNGQCEGSQFLLRREFLAEDRALRRQKGSGGRGR